MKTKIIVTAILVSVVLTFSNIYSQQKNFIISLTAGTNIPVSNLSTSYESGISLDGKLGIILDRSLAVGINAEYNLFNPKQNNDIIFSGGKFTELSFKGFLMLRNFVDPTTLAPYGILSFGINMNKNTESKSIYGISPASDYLNRFAMDIGGGISFKALSNLEFMLEPKFTGTFETDVNNMYFSIKGGVMFSF